MKKHTTDAAKMMRALRAERRAAGLCPYCGEKNDRPGKYYCTNCAQRHNEKKAEWIENRLVSHICPKCGGELDREGFTCSKCKQKNSLAVAEIKNRYMQQGLCQRCGKARPKPGVKYCEQCAARDKETRRLRRLKENQVKQGDTSRSTVRF
ncbi:MAG TPA: hypothetical protein VHQ46_01920 [Desulfobacteria bacterium]|nr:hypothetical protein [Desulfobacteria bacterium]